MTPIARTLGPVLLSGIVLAGAGRREGPLFDGLPTPVALAAEECAMLPDSTNSLLGAEALAPFYGALARLRTPAAADSGRDPIVVPILHLGDSHIQAGFLTGAIMRLFHRDFGNAGRGLVAPYRLARTNEPSDYGIRSEQPWVSARLTSASRPLPVGIGGVAIGTERSRYQLTVRAYEKDSTEDYSFSRLLVFKHPGAPDWSAEGALADTTPHPVVQTIVLPAPVSELTLAASRSTGDSAIYYGFSLENSRGGVLYHATGVNGALFGHWARTPGWAAQSAALAPALVVLSMGSNEAMADADDFDPDHLWGRIDATVRMLATANPRAVFLLTTPAEVFRRRRAGGRTVYDPNPLAGRVAAVIRDYAAAHGHACWDLHAAAGGDGSSARCAEAGLLRPDHIHFTPEGYALLAGGFYRAIIQGYNRYVVDPDGQSARTAQL